jgi:hypothetical protein
MAHRAERVRRFRRRLGEGYTLLQAAREALDVLRQEQENVQGRLATLSGGEENDSWGRELSDLF